LNTRGPIGVTLRDRMAPRFGALLFFSLFSSACGGSGPSESLVVDVSAAPGSSSLAKPVRGAAIVWTSDPAAAFEVASLWIEPAADGKAEVRHRRNEPVVSAQGSLVRLRKVEVESELSDCEACNAGACKPSGERAITHSVVADDLLANTTQTLVEETAESPESAIGDLERSVILRGAVGSQIFMIRYGSGYGCGAAHPTYFAEPLVFDLPSGATPPLTVPPAIEPGLQARAKKFLVAEYGDCLMDPEETPRLFEITPRFGKSAQLTASYTFLMGAPYVCGFGPGHYSVETTIEDQPLPLGLPIVTIPGWARSAFDDKTLLGISLVLDDEDAKRAAFTATP
jgi:hypothetical protein